MPKQLEPHTFWKKIFDHLWKGGKVVYYPDTREWVLKPKWVSKIENQLTQHRGFKRLLGYLIYSIWILVALTILSGVILLIIALINIS